MLAYYIEVSLRPSLQLLSWVTHPSLFSHVSQYIFNLCCFLCPLHAVLLPLPIPCQSLPSRHCAARAEAAFWPAATPTITWWETTLCPGTAPALCGRKAPRRTPSQSTSASRSTRPSSLGNTSTRLESFSHVAQLAHVQKVRILPKSRSPFFNHWSSIDSLLSLKA